MTTLSPGCSRDFGWAWDSWPHTALFQLVSFVLFFFLMPEGRNQFKKKGIYLALLILAVSSLPVLIWNAQNDWITVTHLGSRAGLETA